MPPKSYDFRRSDALNGCRLMVTSAATNGQLYIDALIDLCAEVEFANAIFSLFDHEGKGWIDSEQWKELLHFNFQKDKSRNYSSLMTLLEGLVPLCTESTEGKLTPTGMLRILGGHGLTSQMMKILSREGQSVSVDGFMSFITNMTATRSNVQVSEEELDCYINSFRRLAGDKKVLTKDTFSKVVSTKNKFFIERAFNIFDQNRNGEVCVDEYTEMMRKVTNTSNEEAVSFLFRIYDKDDNGKLHDDEMLEALKASIDESGMEFDRNELQELVSALWEDSGLSKRSTMTFHDLQNLLLRHEGLVPGLAKSITRWLVPQTCHCSPGAPCQKKKTTVPAKQTHYMQDLRRSMVANKTIVWFFGLFCIINLVLFVKRIILFRNFKNSDGTRNYFYMFSRANGMCLNFNSAMVLVFVLRYTITLLRKLGLATVFPLDQHLWLHKATGVLIFFQSWFHTIMHLTNLGVNVVNSPVKFVLLNNGSFVDPGLYHVPEGCQIDLDNKMQVCPNGTFYTYMDWLLTTRPHILGLIDGVAFPTGVGLIIVITVMALCSLPAVRSSGHFEVFYFTHLLYFVYFFLVILHAPAAYLWLSVPISIFFVELLYRMVSVCVKGGRGSSIVTAGVVLPSRVTSLIIQKPNNFNFSPGDWVFIRIPAIALFEWHPFTISSAPEQAEFFTLHIRGVGGWTNKLYAYFEKEFKLQEEGKVRKKSRLEQIKHSFRRSIKSVTRSEAKYDIEISLNPNPEFGSELDPPASPDHILQPYSNLRRRPSIVQYSAVPTVTISDDAETGKAGVTKKEKVEQRATLPSPITIYIDGPFGAPASNIFRAHHAVLIATGIGVTPFSSILQSIMHRYWASKKECPECKHSWIDDIIHNLYNLTKVDFFWINRDQKSFEWFVQLLSQLEIEQAQRGGGTFFDRFLDMHMYITSALQKTDMRAVTLQLALDLLHEKEKRDLVTGLKSRTKAGRPNWDKVFADLKKERKGPITVFYCGNPALASILKKKCREHGLKFRKEVF